MRVRRSGRVVVGGDDAAYVGTIADALGHLGHRVEAVGPGDLARAVGGADVVVVAPEALSGPAGEGWRRLLTDLLANLEAPFVCVLGTDRLADRLAAFDAGADDVVARPVAIPELDARLQVALRRRAAEPARLEVGHLAVDVRAHEATLHGEPLDLTALEFSLLLLLVRHRNSVLSKAQILAGVWGHDRVDENVVEVHISALRRKLERDGPRLIHTVRGAGYVLRPPRPDGSMRLVVG